MIETDQRLKVYLESGRLKIVKGDATNYEDVKKLFEGVKVDVVISSVGMSISLPPVHNLIRDLSDIISPPNLILCHIVWDEGSDTLMV